MELWQQFQGGFSTQGQCRGRSVLGPVMKGQCLSKPKEPELVWRVLSPGSLMLEHAWSWSQYLIMNVFSVQNQRGLKRELVKVKT